MFKAQSVRSPKTFPYINSPTIIGLFQSSKQVDIEKCHPYFYVGHLHKKMNISTKRSLEKAKEVIQFPIWLSTNTCTTFLNLINICLISFFVVEGLLLVFQRNHITSLGNIVALDPCLLADLISLPKY